MTGANGFTTHGQRPASVRHPLWQRLKRPLISCRAPQDCVLSINLQLSRCRFSLSQYALKSSEKTASGFSEAVFIIKEYDYHKRIRDILEKNAKKFINEQNRIYDCICKNRQAINYHICPCHYISYVFFIRILPLTNKSFFCSIIGLLSLDLFHGKSLVVCNRNFEMRFYLSQQRWSGPTMAHFALYYYFAHKRRNLI